MSNKENKGIFREVMEIIKVIISAIFLAVIIVQFVRPTSVEGDSMYPTLHSKDYLILNCLSRYTGVDRGDIIVFDTDMPVDAVNANRERNTYRKILDKILRDDSRTKDLVKRVIGLEGDHIIIKNNKVIVNGQVLNEQYLSPDNVTDGEFDLLVPEGKIFVLGDNRVNSLDSRFAELGFVDNKDVIGEVLVRLLPSSRIGKVN